MSISFSGKDIYIMLILLLLIGLPLLFAGLVCIVRSQTAYAIIVRSGSVLIIIATLIFLYAHYKGVYIEDLSSYEWLKSVVLVLEILIALYIIYVGIKHKSYLVVLFSAVQAGAFIWFETTKGHTIEVTESIYVDKLSILMIAIIGIIGSLICIYAVGYMKDYHEHHTEIKDNRHKFYAVLFLFLSAMFGLVVCNDMVLMLFCWEITSLCSFLLIGYTKTEQAIKNSFTAITINVFGGLCFAIGIIILGVKESIIDFNSLLDMDPTSPIIIISVFLIAIGGLTKSAQLPFSKWLLGAMVAPTPTSALLHSSTMVKAGVYLIIRLAPMFGHNAVGITITLIGGITFFATAVLAVSQSDAKKILAYSTISNLGLIVACAGINTAESLWAAIMLIVFHAVAKSLLFLSVGSTEHRIGSRNVEDMDGLYRVSRTLTMLLIIGIAGMFLAPFGMLISKWAAMKAFLDAGNILIILLIAYGSTVTLFFWTKWMGKLIANFHRVKETDHVMGFDEEVSLFPLAAMVIVVCAFHPLLSSKIIIPYIDSNMHIDFTSPIAPINTSIIIFMMCMLFIVPLILMPFHKQRNIGRTSVYLAGENTGDDESFRGGMGEVRDLHLQNWYMRDIIREPKALAMCCILCTVILSVGLLIAMGGAIL